MARTFATGRGHVELTHPRPTLADDFGRRLVTFGLIGALSTIASLLLFLLFRNPLGAIAANGIAVTATFAANTWLNARFTYRAHRPRWKRAIAIYCGAIALTSSALLIVSAAGGGVAAEVGALCLTWAMASLARFVLLGRSTPTRNLA